jgi:methionine aminopeptidase
MSDGESRGQVVVLAAVVVAVALVAMATAYHGLGYHGDVRVAADVATEDPVWTAERQLQRDIDTVAVSTPRSWAARGRLVNESRETLRASADSLRRTGQSRRLSYVVRENDRVANRWAETDCPGGAMRAFGPCVADGGIVVQERANETVLVGVAVDVVVRTTDGETRATIRLVAR